MDDMRSIQSGIFVIHVTSRIISMNSAVFGELAQFIVGV